MGRLIQLRRRIEKPAAQLPEAPTEGQRKRQQETKRRMDFLMEIYGEQIRQAREERTR